MQLDFMLRYLIDVRHHTPTGDGENEETDKQGRKLSHVNMQSLANSKHTGGPRGAATPPQVGACLITGAEKSFIPLWLNENNLCSDDLTPLNLMLY